MKRFAIAIACCISLAACSRSKPEETRPAAPEQARNIADIGLEAQEHFGVRVAPCRVVQITEHLQVTGTVQPVSSRVAQVRPLARGRVLEVLAGVGARVRAGQPLARFDNMEAGELVSSLAGARAELGKLRIQIEAQARQVERSRRLAEIGAAPRKEYEQNRAEQQAMEQGAHAQENVVAGLAARLERFGAASADPRTPAVRDVSAPFSGVVTRVDVAPGTVVSSDTELFTVADLSHVWVQAEVYEKDLGRIRVGQPARVFVDTYPDQPFTGKVTYISDVLDPQTRTAKVRCELSNRDMRLKLDMFATVQLPTTFSRRALAVPTDAIQQVEGKNVVFVRLAPTRFEAREITAGKAVNGLTQVLRGLREGEPIATEGAFHLKSMVVGGGNPEE